MKRIAIFSLATLASAVACGDTLGYKASGASPNAWSTTANWYDSTLTTAAGRLPGASDTAILGAGLGTTVVEVGSETAATAAVVKVGASAKTSALLLSGGTLTTVPTAAWTKGIVLGSTAGTSGLFTMTGGKLDMISANNYGLLVGDYGTGVFRMSGGTVSLNANSIIQAGFNSGASGEIYLTGGTLPAKTLYLGVLEGATGTLHVAGSDLTRAGGDYYVGHGGTGVFDYNYTGECASGSKGPLPQNLYVGGCGSYHGVGQATLNGTFWINWYAGAGDGRGIHVGNAGRGEVDVYGTVKTAKLDVGGSGGAEVRLHEGSSTYVSHCMYVGQGYGVTSGSGRLVMDGGTLTLASDTSTATYRLTIGGTDEKPMAGSICGYGTVTKNVYAVPIAFGREATVTAAGGTLSFAGSGTVANLAASDDTTNGWYVADDGVLKFPSYTIDKENKQYVGEEMAFGVGCEADAEGPSLLHSCVGILSNYWGKSCLQGEFHGRASSEIPKGCPIVSSATAIGFWKLSYAWNTAESSAGAYCDSFVLKFRLKEDELHGSGAVGVYRSVGSGWKRVAATYDPKTHVVTLAPIKYTFGASPNIGWFAIGFINPGMIILFR